MVFLGYILPKKNQEDYLREIEIAVQNYRNDLLNRFNLKTKAQMPMQAPVTVQTPMPVQAPMPMPVQASVPVQAQLKVEIPKPSSPLIAELEGKIRSPNLGLRSKASSPASSEAASAPSSPTPSVASTMLSEQDMLNKKVSTEMQKLIDEYELVKNSPSEREKFYEKAKKTIIQAIENGHKIYGASANNKPRNKFYDDKFLLKVIEDKDGNKDLAWEKYKHKGGAFTNNNLVSTLRTNEDALYKAGSGLVSKKSKKAKNPDNFHGFHLSPLGLSKGDLSIYYPNTSRRVLSWKNMSPLLSKIVSDIRKDKSFKLDEYERLKETEKVVVDKIITLLRMLYPAGMKRASEEDIWNLRNRYAILLGEINAGNNSILLKEELADIVNKLKEYKVISAAKQKFILEALQK